MIFKKWYHLLLIGPAMLYKWATDFRNHLFDIDYKKSIRFNLPIIGVGNLSIGGSGKTPTVEKLISLLANDYQIGVISRGYGRKTHGFLLADEQKNAHELGDEPMQIYQGFKQQISMAVGEERALAIPYLLAERPHINMIILDDAFQHRYVHPSIQILLTTYEKPFFRDMLLPLGRLRESRKGAKRADIVIVSKCPEMLQVADRAEYEAKIRKYTREGTPILFAREKYLSLQTVDNRVIKQKPAKVILLTAIAHAKYLKTYLEKEGIEIIKHLEYRDHYRFGKKDIQLIAKWMKENSDAVLITTAKDMVKLQACDQYPSLEESRICIQKVEMAIDEDKLKKIIQEYLIKTGN